MISREIESTPIQQTIENTVTSGKGYDFLAPTEPTGTKREEDLMGLHFSLIYTEHYCISVKNFSNNL